MMNPQILIDGVQHGARGMIVIFDNRRMAAISGLQKAQYGAEFRTNDAVAVDYVRLAAAVQRRARRCSGGDTPGRTARRADEAPRARRPVAGARAGLRRRPTRWAASAPTASGTSATGARTAEPYHARSGLRGDHEASRPGLYRGTTACSSTASWRAAQRRRTFAVVDPATEDVIGRSPAATDADLDDALASAQRGPARSGARRAPGSAQRCCAAWPTLSAAASTRRRADDRRNRQAAGPVARRGLSDAPTSSTGMPTRPSASTATPWTAAAPTCASRCASSRSDLVAAFSAWNFPSLLPARKIAPALAPAARSSSSPPARPPAAAWPSCRRCTSRPARRRGEPRHRRFGCDLRAPDRARRSRKVR